MLGKPVVGRVDFSDGEGLPATRCILDTTIVHADENSIADVLRDLALDPSKRREIGAASREHAVHWWSAERLAGRFEYVYDHIRIHGRPPAEEDVP
jgi:glycosyltransferase involved in cell wall biosynthesis